MKCLLLFFCLFGAALAVSWQPYGPEVSSRHDFLSHSITYLTFQISHLPKAAVEYSSSGLTYFVNPIKELVNRMDRLRTEMRSFPVKTNTVHRSVSIAAAFNQDLIYERLVNDYRSIVHETLRLYQKNRQERSKQLALTVVGYQNIAYDSQMPEARQLIADVKAIITREVAIQQVGDLADRERMMALLDKQYQELDRTLVKAETIITEKTQRFYALLDKARNAVDSLGKPGWFGGVSKKAELVENALNLAESLAAEMFKLVPIENQETADRMVTLAGIAIRAGKNLELLLEDVDD